ncbi:hypothetical protein K488DRAFT_71159 [Vararia minispora EC-137]|uniref:Uncharacterized protein n=1 Tax=Vararia minispora EC-137 TaxID=1314806 RepID=A0ACB8QIY6_9AGAM|nr:hypothetical protein K488DRAFT_71159 [Vararia minispora EC-137]
MIPVLVSDLLNKQSQDTADPGSFAALAELVGALSGIAADRYIAIFASTLCVWEFLINLDAEIRLIWTGVPQSRKRMTIQALYIFLRYTVLLAMVFNVLVIGNVLPDSDACDKNVLKLQGMAVDPGNDWEFNADHRKLSIHYGTSGQMSSGS